ncbi:MAG: S-adenosyl-l-methionine hydroxide adenosyltransferase family protein [Thiohalomonadales bacterium]
MIVLFTDFGNRDPYIGQVKNVLVQLAPSVPVIDLFNNAPMFDPRASAYLLAAYVNEFPADSVFLAVVDPGVGASSRRAIVLRIDARWYVGPDNGLFNRVALQAADPRFIECWQIDWRPDRLSNTFHGRDLFAPIAARIALGEHTPGTPLDSESVIDPTWPNDHKAIIYIDHYGNAISGIAASQVTPNTQLTINNHHIAYARTYSEVAVGAGFWYENANGLVEIACNQASARDRFDLKVGSVIKATK